MEQRPPKGQDGDRAAGHDPARVRELVARVVTEAVDRTDRSPRKAGELLLSMGFGGKKPGEPYSEGAVRNWMKQVDRPLAEVIIALALHHELSLDEYLWGDGLRRRVNELEQLMLRIARHTGYELPEGREATAGD